MSEENIIEKLFEGTVPKGSGEQYKKLGLKHNPFPKSGTTNIGAGDIYTRYLTPVNSEVQSGIKKFIWDSLYAESNQKDDKFTSAVVVGDYGSGKTQLLMYVKYLLNATKTELDNEYYRNPYVVYIDNPGVKVNELIGNIIREVGEENFKKYLWKDVVDKLDQDGTYKARIEKFLAKDMFADNYNPFTKEFLTSYKNFLDACMKSIYGKTNELKKFQVELKDVIISILSKKFEDSAICEYFYDLISDSIGINKTWELLTTGSGKHLETKQVALINAVVQLVKSQGFTHFFLLIDEFEDVTEGRLSKAQIDSYLYNLRTLLDRERQWCLMFSMTNQALEKLRSISPPLADRIEINKITLTSLNMEEAKSLLNNYLSKSGQDIEKFIPDDALKTLLDKVDNKPRLLLQSLFSLIEKASNELQEGETITKEFLTKK